MKRGVAALVAVVLVLALALTAALTLTGGGSGGGDAVTGGASTRVRVATSPTPQPGSTKAPEPGLDRFYAQRVAWGDCSGAQAGKGFQCGTLLVPVDYRDPGGRTVRLALLKVPAADPSRRIGSLVVNPGGPGEPGTTYAAAADQQFGTAITDAYDVVGFDPRGTGDSDPVECLTASQLDAYTAADPSPDTAAERAALTANLRAFWQGCAQRSDDLLGHVTTVEAARDMDVLRAALGERRLDYLGASYGTKLGATYADLFPRQVGRFVLDGAVDVALSSRELSLGQAGGFETALRAYVQNCLDTEDPCFLGSSMDAALGKVKSILDSIDAKPLPTRTGGVLKVGDAFSGLAFPLYSRTYWGYLTQALQGAIAGDGTLLKVLANAYYSRSPGGQYENNSAQATTVINCLDDPYSIAPSQVAAQLPAFEKVSPTLGDVFAWSLVTCRGDTERATETDRVIDAKGAAPIVVVGTTRDPATPYAWAQALARELTSGVLVTRVGDGHTGYHVGSPCVDSAVEDYLVDGKVPQDGLRCETTGS